MEYSGFFNNSIIALPNWEKPRVIISIGSIKEVWANSSAFLASTIFGKIRKTYLRVLGSINFLEQKQGTNSFHINEFLDLPIENCKVSALVIGNKGTSENYTLQIRGKDGNIFGYLKIAFDAPAILRLDNEFKVISKIPSGKAPSIIKYGRLSNGYGLYITNISSKLGIFSNRQTDSTNLKKYLNTLHQGDLCEFYDHPWIKKIQSNSNIELDFAHNLSNRQWPIVIMHGDFAPWNILASEDGCFTALDWEYGDLFGFPYIDFSYFYLQYDCLVKKLPSRISIITTTKRIRAAYPNLSLLDAKIIIKLTGIYGFLLRISEGHMIQERTTTWWKGISDMEVGNE